MGQPRRISGHSPQLLNTASIKNHIGTTEPMTATMANKPWIALRKLRSLTSSMNAPPKMYNTPTTRMTTEPICKSVIAQVLNFLPEAASVIAHSTAAVTAAIHRPTFQGVASRMCAARPSNASDGLMNGRTGKNAWAAVASSSTLIAALKDTERRKLPGIIAAKAIRSPQNTAAITKPIRLTPKIRPTRRSR